MTETISARDYSYEIQSLKELITTIQTNLYFTIGIIITILGISIALATYGLHQLVKSWLNKRFDLEIKSIEEKMKVFLAENPPLFWANGKGVLISSSTLGGVSPAYTHEYQIIGVKNFSKEDIIYIDAYYIQDGNKIAIDDYNVFITDTGVKVNVIESLGSFKPKIQVNVFLLWSNPKFRN